MSVATSEYVERRGKPSTWLPRQKLAEERIPSATTKSENLLQRDTTPRSKMFSSRITPPRSKTFKKKQQKKYDPNYPVTFSIPRKLQSTSEFQEISLTQQRHGNSNAEAKRTVGFPARVKILSNFSPKLRSPFPDVCPRLSIPSRGRILSSASYCTSAPKHVSDLQRESAPTTANGGATAGRAPNPKRRELGNPELNLKTLSPKRGCPENNLGRERAFLMWSGAVNRQPGYAPETCRGEDRERNHHDRKLSLAQHATTIGNVREKKKTKKRKKKKI